MGRHADSSAAAFDVRRAARLTGVVGGAGWVLAALLGGAGAEAARWVGAVLVTVALCVFGALLVGRGLLPLRILVAVALPTLVWAVLLLARSAAGDPRPVDAAFGASVALASGLTALRGRGRAARHGG